MGGFISTASLGEGFVMVVAVFPPLTPANDQVDDKYQYSCDNKDNKVRGWICVDPPVGFWKITPSDEFRTGGPVKQNLTSHVRPTTLAELQKWLNDLAENDVIYLADSAKYVLKGSNSIEGNEGDCIICWGLVF